MTLDSSGAGQVVQGVVKAQDGGRAVASSGPIDIDLDAPTVTVGGVKAGKTYKKKPTPTCEGSDATSGVVTLHGHGQEDRHEDLRGGRHGGRRGRQHEHRGEDLQGQEEEAGSSARPSRAGPSRPVTRRLGPDGDSGERQRHGLQRPVGGSIPLNGGSGWICWSPAASVHTSAITERPWVSTTQASRRRRPQRVHAS